MSEAARSGTASTSRTSRAAIWAVGVPRIAAAPSAAVARLALLAALAGCSQLEPAPVLDPVTDPAELYVRLTLNHAAVNLATDQSDPKYYTLQLVATPQSATGAPIADAPAATFRSLGDTTKLRVTPDGMLEALQQVNEIRVVAELTLAGVRRTDTAVVNVRAGTPPALDAFSIQVPADSAVWYVSSLDDGVTLQLVEFIPLIFGTRLIPARTLSPRAVDATGNPIAGLNSEFVSLDSAVARVDRWTGSSVLANRSTLVAPGHARIVARTFAFGVAKADTMTYTVQPPFTADFSIDRQGFLYSRSQRPVVPSRTIVAGGIIGWWHTRATPMDVTFDNPTNVVSPPVPFCDLVPLAFELDPGPYCGTGNISTYVGDSLSFAGYRFRQFPVPGTYPFRSTTTGARGQIIVLEPVPSPSP